MVRKTKVFVKRKIRKTFQEVYSKKDINELGDKPFVIISNNCWGGSAYQWYKREYNTPFVGLFFYGACYMKLLKNFDYYIKQELTFIPKSKYPDIGKSYPIGLLDDIEIHFEHFNSNEEAKKKWDRRRDRMLKVKNKDRYFFKICDRELTTKDDLVEFHNLPYKNKISFSIHNYDELKEENHIKVLEIDRKNRSVPNGKKLFELTYLYFNMNEWLMK
ncbi:DUF1919 domain-containing protein [Seonamhaeicola aphaedonensis]|uniref:Uncharacterized protein (DUF1919 family) n=1 Tax=Seonamhaeicola aphaedonensis TaxID=1461338 RepID=A0A3D9H710_9FLAO|nr:DUF1919 domain-containing protein [Seonamhaeicola aphaedonensis]RED44941.1 uncharacterized protein (DUF1919 family) [Seonamhaeicola aphaedonensis]